MGRRVQTKHFRELWEVVLNRSRLTIPLGELERVRRVRSFDHDYDTSKHVVPHYPYTDVQVVEDLRACSVDGRVIVHIMYNENLRRHHRTIVPLGRSRDSRGIM